MSGQTLRRALLLASRDPFANYVPTLAPLLWLPLTETTGLIAVNAMYTAGIGAELLTNADFSSWSGDNPTWWSVNGELAGDPEITERDSGQAHADSKISGGSANLYSSATANLPQLIEPVPLLVVGDTYLIETDISYIVNSNGLEVLDGGGSIVTYSSTGDKQRQHIARGTIVQWRGNLALTDVTLDRVSIRKIGELDGLIAGTTSLGQAGKRGPLEAFLFDGATSLITVKQRAAINGLTALSFWCQCKASSAGENDAGALAVKTDDFEICFNSASGDLYAKVDYDTSDAEAVTSSLIPMDEWVTVELSIEDSSKTIAISINGLEASYASNTPGVGSRSSSLSDLVIGNRSTLDRTFDGLFDEALLLDRVLSSTERQVLEALA